jgi:hypothetical protein
MKAHPKAVGKILAGAQDAKSTDWSDQYWFACALLCPSTEQPLSACRFPQFDTASEKYAWLTNTAFVAKGRFQLDHADGALQYDVFRME